MAKKSQIQFVCQECGYESSQWLGKCPECGNWNTLREIKIPAGGSSSGSGSRVSHERLKPVALTDVSYNEKERIKTGFSEFDGVLGGGIVPGAVVLVAGDPGVGKSTLLLQAAVNISNNFRAGVPPHIAGDAQQVKSRSQSLAQASLSERRLPNIIPKSAQSSFSSPASGQTTTSIKNVLYISAEESAEQIKLRASRMSQEKDLANIFILSATDTDAIASIIEEVKPGLVIVDSIQTVESGNIESLAGSVGQVRYAAFTFIKLAKANKIPILLVGHVTKEGTVAGPMVLSHMVDVVLFLEGEKNTGTRILRGLKNRFGPIDEVGIFQMSGVGMEEVKNPEQIFLTERRENIPGSVLVATLEGTRAFLVEVQALVVPSKLALPRRVVSGMDAKRVELLLAVLQKHCGIPVGTMDVFINVAGGLKLSDPAADVGVCLSVVSSFKGVPLPKTVGMAEVGLLGEMRQVPNLPKRIKQAEKLGFTTIITAKSHRFVSDVIKSVGKIK